MGVIAKDSSAGPFADEWKSAYGDISKEVEEIDITMALSAAALAIKDENELVSVSKLQSSQDMDLMRLTTSSGLYAMRRKPVPG